MPTVPLTILPMSRSVAVQFMAPSQCSAETLVRFQAPVKWHSRGTKSEGSSASTGTRMESLGSEASESERENPVSPGRSPGMSPAPPHAAALTCDEEPGPVPKLGVRHGGGAVIIPRVLTLHIADTQGENTLCSHCP